MMGHRERLVDGDEYDALTRGKHFHKWRAGDRAAIKRRFNKRVRRTVRSGLRRPGGDGGPAWQAPCRSERGTSSAMRMIEK
jgi:hypothetical protein